MMRRSKLLFHGSLLLKNLKAYGLYTGTAVAGAAVTRVCNCRSLVVAAEARLVVGGVELVTSRFSIVCAVLTTELLFWRAADPKLGRVL